MVKITGVCYFFDDEMFVHSVLKSVYKWVDELLVFVGTNKYNEKHWSKDDKSFDNTCEIIHKFIKTDDLYNKITFYDGLFYEGNIPFSTMKNIGINEALIKGADWYFEIDAGEIYRQQDLELIVNTINNEGDKWKLFVWPFYTFYPDLKHGYIWPAGELRCFKLTPETRFIEDRRSAFLYKGDLLLWPMSANKPAHPKYGKVFDFYCYHLDDLKPSINQLHRELRRILYKENRTDVTMEDIDKANNKLKKKSILTKISKFTGEYPEYLITLNRFKEVIK